MLLQLPIDVFQNGHYLGRFVIRNVNSSGAFIETGAIVQPDNGILELTFAAGDIYDGDVSRHLQALVVRRTADGVGVWFATGDEVFYRRMVDVLGQLIDLMDPRGVSSGRRALH
jgi:hypothetical protein